MHAVNVNKAYMDLLTYSATTYTYVATTFGTKANSAQFFLFYSHSYLRFL